jgi:hypothetical protein
MNNKTKIFSLILLSVYLSGLIVESTHRHYEYYSYVKTASKISEGKDDSHDHESEIHDNCPLCNLSSNRVSFVQNFSILFYQTVVLEFQNEDTFAEITCSVISIPPRSPPQNLI